MKSQTHLILRLIAFVLLVFTSACAAQQQAPAPIAPNSPQQQLQNPPKDAGNKADDEDEKDGDDDDEDEKQGEGNEGEKD